LLDLFFLPQVLLPCSRPKIFKNTGPFSYKRLLPYLMQASDGTCLFLFCVHQKLEFDMLNCQLFYRWNIIIKPVLKVFESEHH